ncbi:MAG: hypothetical protein AABZ55_10340 [Bdellovibrionota bacterium]
MRTLCFLLFCASALYSPFSHAFPEMVRNHYPNCISCHISPNGGGVLSAYGRELSGEVLSTWANESEGLFAHGLIRTPEILALGGDIRAVQLYENTAKYVEGRFIFMQADLEAALTLNSYQAVATVGSDDGELILRRHWLGYRPNDQISFRAGKFLPEYGIKTPDHEIATRKGLGFNENDESYNFEAAWIGDRLNVFGTGIFGRLGKRSQISEKGFALSGSYTFFDSIKPGMSYLLGSTKDSKRHIAGPWAIFGMTPHLFILSEFDFQWNKSSDAADFTRGWVDYQRIDYEITQGFHAYLTQEMTKLDFSTSETTESYGVGIQVFPRPHFEFNLQWQKVRNLPSTTPRFNDFAWILMHYYL